MAPMRTTKKKASPRDEPLFRAIQEKKVDAVKAAIVAGARANAAKNVDEYPQIRPLHLAVVVGRQEIAELLLDRGAEMEGTDQDGRTALHYSCGALIPAEAVEIGMVRFLVERGAQVEARDVGNGSPLFAAIEAHRLDIAEYLIDHGADCGVVTSLGTLMESACKSDDTAVFQFLRSKGLPLENPRFFDLETRQIMGPTGTLLHVAAIYGSATVAKALLSAGAERDAVQFNVLRKTEQTPLELALEFGQVEVAKVLLEAGAKISPEVAGRYGPPSPEMSALLASTTPPKSA